MSDEKNKESESLQNQNQELNPTQENPIPESNPNNGDALENAETPSLDNILKDPESSETGEQIITDQTAGEIEDHNINAADGITTASDFDPDVGSGEKEAPSEEPAQGEISQEEAIAAIKQNRLLRRENQKLKSQVESFQKQLK